ncbi:DNA polymerase I, partial [Staphylococcus equorum]
EGTSVKENTAVYGKGKSYKVPDFSILSSHIATVLDAIEVLQPVMKEKLMSNAQMELLEEIELPLAIILGDMEYTGIYTDINTLKAMENEIQAKLDTLIADIHAQAGETFNINSPKQLGVILFEKLELPIIKKTKT